MTTFRLVGILLLLLVGFAASSIRPADAAASCDTASAAFSASRQAGDIDKSVAAYGVLTDSVTGCSEQVVHCAGDSVARAYVEASYAAADRNATPADVEAILEKGRAYGSPWQLLVGLGDTHFALGRSNKDGAEYEKAAANYQDALDVISEDPACSAFGEPPLPTADEIAPIHQRMTEALLLAPTFEVVRTREGNCGGIFLASVRGFKPQFRPIPITFVFGQATFTPEGEKAAGVLLDCARDEKYSRIVMSGHTDPVGTDESNMALSKRRLDAVAIYLKKGGFAGDVVLEPKGESEPFQPDDPTAYTQDEIYQLDRRVAILETDK